MLHEYINELTRKTTILSVVPNEPTTYLQIYTYKYKN